MRTRPNAHQQLALVGASVTRLRGKNALVTGAGQRVGAAIARRLAQAGANVAVHYHGSSEGAARTKAEVEKWGVRAVTLQADLCRRTQCRTLIDGTLQAMGGLDLLVASAANYERTVFESEGDENWDRALRLNLTAPFVLVHHARQALRQSQGCVVFLTDAALHRPYMNYAPYLVSKAALQQLMRVLALELAPQVRVNAVAPGTVLAPPGLGQDRLEQIRERVPLGRLGKAQDVAEAVHYLCEAPYVNGHELVVDGGRTLGPLLQPES